MIKAYLIATASIAALLFIFDHWSEVLLVRIVGILFSLLFLTRMFSQSFEFGINRKVFGKDENKIFMPDMNLRKAVGLFRGFAEMGEDRFIFVLTHYGTVIAIAGIVSGRWWWLTISALLFSFTSVHAVRVAWPGFTLVLGRSEDKNFHKLFKHVVFATRPFNTTTMVDFPEDLEQDLSTILNNRIQNLVVSWEAAVEVYATLAKVIIVDLDDLEDAVKTELQLIDQKQFWYKTIIFSSDSVNGSLAEVSLRTAPADAGALVTSDIGTVRRAVKSVRKSCAVPLSRENPVSMHAIGRTRSLAAATNPI
ncbi:hypothetical protein ACC696_35715 [Rhizobium ruizarguesonis]|uniref:Uncharacterized protein n=1 Tax=Rhizobium ruizarguesonis TaxID=2081791 RepID=A0ABY1X7L1_9HYPH|nr:MULTISPECIES: hypothetical protein [Rhizobium]MBY5370468.1 hypothetical protein [Rhizobium leguminosarum]TAX81165.1 hypothetical protein ELH98_08845 [Rhizobium ruizarguesonis]TBE22900.1 hypothetical protein ELH08_08330 [Rhizobium ruizarguesonis]